MENETPSLRSYSKIYNLGHRELEGMFEDSVTVEEKVDGSQFSFGVLDGVVCARSRGQQLDVHGPEKMFKEACETVLEISDKLIPNAIYRGEYLQKPKHNSLAYDRIPEKHIILYDVDLEDQKYMTYDEKAEEAKRLGLEVVPILHYGMVTTFDNLKEYLLTKSCLGGQLIEGVVFKNYIRYGGDKKVLMAKHVSEAFKEIHNKDWKLRHPAGKDVKETIIDSLRTPARWNKGIQHLRELGKITDSPKDIGPLMKEISSDVKIECEDFIKESLFKWAWKDINRGVMRGFAEWYKQELARKQFGGEDGE